MRLVAQEQIKTAKQLLDNGAILAVPTETVYGLAAKFDHQNAIDKLLAVKQRKTQNDNKVITLMLADTTDIAKYAQLNELATQISNQHFPGELTMVLPKNPDFQNYYFNHFQTIGVRIPNHTFMLELLKLTGPLLVTSANLRGLEPCRSSTEVQAQLHHIDATVTGQAGGNPPSTVISIIDSELKTLRQGSIIF